MLRNEVSSSGIQAVPHLTQTFLFPSPEPPSTHSTLVLGQGTWLSPGSGNLKIWGSISGHTSFPLNCLKALCTKMRAPDMLFLPSYFIPPSHHLLSIRGGILCQWSLQLPEQLSISLSDLSPCTSFTAQASLHCSHSNVTPHPMC